MITVTDGRAALETYLHQYDRARTAAGDPEWVYQSHEGLMLAVGRWFTVAPTRIRGQWQSCYYNAWTTASRNKSKGWYFCEGYMVTSWGFVTGHAWVMKPDGTAIDTTPFHNDERPQLFGVAFTHEFCRERQKLHHPNEKYTLLQGDYKTRYSLLRHGLPANSLAPDPLSTGA